MQNKPNSFEDRNNAIPFTTMSYGNKPPCPARKKQTQSNPIPPPHRKIPKIRPKSQAEPAVARVSLNKSLTKKSLARIFHAGSGSLDLGGFRVILRLIEHFEPCGCKLPPLRNMHLSPSSLLAVGLGGRPEDPFEKNTCPVIQATLGPQKRKQATAPCVADTVATIPP